MLTSQERHNPVTPINRVAEQVQPSATRKTVPALPVALKTVLRGKEITCEYVTGRVAGLTRETHTHYSAHTQYNDLTKSAHTSISSRKETRTEFHVQRANGSEEPYWHMLDNIPLRNGQIVTNLHLHWGGYRAWTLLVNHSTSRSYYFRKGAQLIFNLGVVRLIPWWVMLLCFLPFLGIGLAVGSDSGSGIIGFGLLACLAFWIGSFVVQFIRAMILWQSIKPEVHALLQLLKEQSILR